MLYYALGAVHLYVRILHLHEGLHPVRDKIPDRGFRGADYDHAALELRTPDPSIEQIDGRVGLKAASRAAEVHQDPAAFIRLYRVLSESDLANALTISQHHGTLADCDLGHRERQR